MGGFGGGGIAGGRGGGGLSHFDTQANAESQYEGKHGIFISHGAVDKAIADAFVDFLEGICAGTVKCVQSSSKNQGTGIPYGTEWFPWIKRHVDAAKTLIVLLTPDSAAKPWVLFEAGLGKANPDRPVIAIAVFVPSDIAFSGPFGALQGMGVGEEDLRKLSDQLQSQTGTKQAPLVVDTLIKALHSRLEEIRLATASSTSREGNDDPVLLELRAVSDRLSKLIDVQAKLVEVISLKSDNKTPFESST